MKPVLNRVAALAVLTLWAAYAVAAENAADEILVLGPYARAVPAVVDNSAMFMTLKNTGSRNHALVGASSRAAKVVELHTHINDGGVMRMRPVPKIDIGAGSATTLEPGGLHIMLIGLKRPLLPGATVQVDLEFEDGSHKPVVAEVRSVGGMHQHGGQDAGAAAPSEPAGPIFVNLTSDDDWRAGMALRWTRLAMTRNHKATIFLNVDAVRLAVSSVPHPVNAMQGKTAQEMLAEAAADGARVLVCPGCLKRAGFHRDDLIEGVELASPDKVFPALYADGVRVMSW